MQKWKALEALPQTPMRGDVPGQDIKTHHDVARNNCFAINKEEQIL